MKSSYDVRCAASFDASRKGRPHGIEALTPSAFFPISGDRMSGFRSRPVGGVRVRGLMVAWHRLAAALVIVSLTAVLASCDAGTEPRVPSALDKVDGDVQTTTVNTPVSTTPRVRVRDQDGAPLAGVTVSFSVLEGAGSISTASAVTDGNGVASVGIWTLGTRVGPNVLSASAGAVASVHFTAAGAPAAPAQLTVTAGAGQQGRVDEPVLTPPSVRVADVFGNPTPDVEVTFFAASGAGQVEGALQRTDPQGIATVGSWRLGQTVGENSLTALVAGGASTTVTASATAGPPSVMFGVLGEAGVAQVASAVPQPPAAKVTDAFGNPVAGVEVSFSASPGGSVEPSTAITGADGLAVVTRWTLSTVAGVNALTASAAELPPLTFSATGTAAEPASVAASAGQSQSAPAGTAVPVSPAALVTDAYGNPVTGAAVTFVVVSGGGSVSGAAPQTNSSGVATVGSWILGPSAGLNVLEARTPGGAVARFDATATSISGGGDNGSYDVNLRFGSGLTPSQQAIFQQAALRWQSIITGDVASVPIALAGNQCGSNPPLNETVDDLVIFASAVSIDGVSGVLGRAGPCLIRNSNSLPVVGFMEFDAADMAALEASGNLLHVILHEIGHVLGIGTIWELKGLLSGKGTSLPSFTGARATEAFDAVGGTSFGGEKVPVEGTGGSGTRDAHWRESVMGTELMTGYMNGGVTNPLSIVTISSLRDLGYQVDTSRADPYTLSGSPMAAPGVSGERLELIELPAPAPSRVGPDGAIQKTHERE
jgi:hypothetical protein